MSRADIIGKYIDLNGLGLEIGPSFQPAFRKADGWNVEVLDHASADDLRKHYGAIGHPINLIEDVDYVSDGRLMHEVIPHKERYDWIFAAHVIEHVTDFLGFFKSCEKLLKPNGTLVLAVPDKRYCFDVFRPISTTGQVLEAYYAKHTRHAPSKVFDHFSSIAVLEGRSGWDEKSEGRVWLAEFMSTAWSRFERSLDTGSAYIDVHGWQFTPSSFRLLIRDLQELKLLNLRECALTGGDDVEFVIALDRTSPEYLVSRNELMLEMHREIRAGINQMLRPIDPPSAAELELQTVASILGRRAPKDLRA